MLQKLTSAVLLPFGKIFFCRVGILWFGAMLLSSPTIARECFWDGSSPICRGRCPAGYDTVKVKACLNGFKVQCCEKLGSVTNDGPDDPYRPVPQTPAPQTQASGFAAVAVDGRGAWSASLGLSTARAAGADAVSRCGGSCRVVMTGRGRCVAFADSNLGGYWYGHGYGNNARSVRRIAMDGCSAGAPAGSCRIKHVNCR